MPRKRTRAWTDDEFDAECKRRGVFALSRDCKVGQYLVTSFKTGELGQRVLLVNQVSRDQDAEVPED